jgi:hypothetical protein
MKQSYPEKLRDPRWQKKRLEILNRDEFTCQECLDKGTTLHIHHKSYIKGRDPWDYEDFNLITLCEVCHEIEEKIISQKKALKERLELKYQNLPQHCPACGCEEVKIYYSNKIECPICKYRCYLDGL